MRNEQRTMTDEMFAELIQQDKWIRDIALPVKCCDQYGKFRHYRTCTYPVEYLVSEDQIARAKVLYQKRHDEVLANIKKGELVFCAMGCDFSPRYEDDVCNHRMRCYMKDFKGRTWFVELSTLGDFWGDGFHYDFAHEVTDGEHCYGTGPKFPRAIDGDGNKLRWEDKRIFKSFTWTNVLKDINVRFKCKYTSARLERYFVNCEEWVCEC